MELRHLRYFVAVAETLNMRKAADKLHISQPPLSLQIRDLERELGTPLFSRDKNRLKLTDAGVLFFDRAKTLLSEAQKAKTDAGLAAQGKIGTMIVRFNSSAVTGILQKLISPYKRAHPGVHLDLEQSNVEAILHDLQDKKIDIGFVRIPVQVHDDLAVKLVLKESYYVALPKDHKLTKKTHIHPRDLMNDKLIIYPRSTASGSFDHVMSLFAAHKLTPGIEIEAPEQLTIAGLVAAGMGYSIVPECMIHIKVPGIVHRPLIGGQNGTGIALVTRKDAGETVKTFLNF